VGVLVADGGKPDLLPTWAGGKTGGVEVAAFAGLRQSGQRNGLLGRGATGVLDQLHESGDRGPGRGGGPPPPVGAGPAGAAVGGDALRLVERGGIEPGFLRKAGRRKPREHREAVECHPDLRMRQHDVTNFNNEILSNSRNYSLNQSSNLCE